jgi:hypothetical protein
LREVDRGDQLQFHNVSKSEVTMSKAMSRMTRRQFGLTLAAAPVMIPLGRSASGDAPWNDPAIVRKVFVGVPKPTWPRPDLDLDQEMSEINAKLAELERKNPGQIRLTGGDWIKSVEDVEPWAKSLGDADAVLVLDLTSSTGPMLQAIGKVDIPRLLFTRPITGWAFMEGADWIQKGLKGDMVASSSFEDLVPLFPILRNIHHLRYSRILVVTPSGSSSMAAGFAKQFGTAIDFPTYQDLKEAYDRVDAGKVEEEAGKVTRGALKVMEPSAEEIRKASRFYLAALDILRQAKANAITIDCLGGFRRGDLPAYPCVAWSKLNDCGMYGVCEADLQSTMTQLLITGYSAKAGFVSDPTFDTSRNEVIHAHCVAATRMRGIGGAASPYILRSHMEDNRGVSVQVEMPVREMITCAKFADPHLFLVSTGEVTANVDAPRGCRTKIVTRVADARKLVEGWSAGLHRVIFYGDYVEAARRMGRMMGFRVVQEG